MEPPKLSHIERIIPLLAGTASAVAALYWMPVEPAAVTEAMSKMDRLVAPVFDAATFTAGSLFAVYVLALSRAEGFLGQIFKTKTFRIFNTYVASAIALNLALIVLSVWFIVDGVQAYLTLFDKAIVITWIALAAATLASVIRVMTLFLIIVRAGSASPLSKVKGQA